MELALDRRMFRPASRAAMSLSAKTRLTPVWASSKLPRTAYTATLAPSWVAICSRWISLVPPVG